jgi:hypothetical protein
MCTVTFIPKKDRIFITHNRDEKFARLKAVPPKEYVINGYKLLFPRDSQAGGTWIALHEAGKAAVLLNGAFREHQPTPPYRKSRGLLFLDIVAKEDLAIAWANTNMREIEPFTLILWEDDVLTECRWDGERKYQEILPNNKPRTWSSVTLYPNSVLDKREQWFQQWLQAHPCADTEAIQQYHLHGGDGDIENDLRMNRNNTMLTVSITCMELTEHTGTVHYIDLLDNAIYQQQLDFIKAPISR